MESSLPPLRLHLSAASRHFPLKYNRCEPCEHISNDILFLVTSRIKCNCKLLTLFLIPHFGNWMRNDSSGKTLLRYPNRLLTILVLSLDTDSLSCNLIDVIIYRKSLNMGDKGCEIPRPGRRGVKFTQP